MILTRTEFLEAAILCPGDRVRVLAFHVEVSFEGNIDASTGMVANLKILKSAIQERVVVPYSGKVFSGKSPSDPRTPEEWSRVLWEKLEKSIPGIRLVAVRLTRDGQPFVECFGKEGIPMDVTHRYEFSAAHRLHAPGLGDVENREIFGKCNNPEGHGHNYVLEVTWRGQLDAEGALLPAEVVDRVVLEEVVDRWDHKNLNRDLAEFQGVNPTAEEIARLAFRRIELATTPHLKGRARLYRVKLRETARNSVEYFGDEKGA